VGLAVVFTGGERMKNRLIEKFRFIVLLPTNLKSLLASSFVMAFGSFMVTPFLAVFLKNSIGMEMHAVGILVAIATFVQFGGGILGGIVAERFGFKASMVGALSYRTFGFVLLAAAPKFPILTIPAVLLVAAGSALYLPANRAYVVSSVSAEVKPLFLSLSNAALNAGMALGPLLAAILIDRDPVLLLLGVALLFAVLTIVHQLTLGPKPLFQAPISNIGLKQLPDAIRRAGSAGFFSTYIFYVYFFFQSFMGLYAASVSNLRVFSWGMMLNFLMMFVLQPWLSRRIAGANYRRLLIGAFSLMGIGMATMALATTPTLLLGIAIMTLGQIFLFLRADLEVLSRLPETPAIAFGIQRLAAGVGGLASGIVGGWAFEYYKNTGYLGTFWFFVAGQCALGIVLSLFFAQAEIITDEMVQPC
jgi:MFS family permease